MLTLHGRRVAVFVHDIVFYFRAEIEEVQNDVSELETRLEKVRRTHIHPHTLLCHWVAVLYCVPHTHTMWSERWASGWASPDREQEVAAGAASPSYCPATARPAVCSALLKRPRFMAFIIMALRRKCDCGVVCLHHPAGETMSGHVGGREGLLPDQQDLRQRPAWAGTPQLKGQDDGGEKWDVRCRRGSFKILSCGRDIISWFIMDHSLIWDVLSCRSA